MSRTHGDPRFLTNISVSRLGGPGHRETWGVQGVQGLPVQIMPNALRTRGSHTRPRAYSTSDVLRRLNFYHNWPNGTESFALGTMGLGAL